MSDVLDSLKRLAEPGPGPAPLAPAEVRRRGDRRRRRHTAGMVAAGLVVVAGAAVGIGQLDGDGGRAAAPVGPVTTTLPGQVLGHQGMGRVRLGMTWTQARATGEVAVVRPSAAAPGCTGFVLREFPPLSGGSVDGYVSPRHGVEAIFARAGIQTPEGVGVGSTAAEVEAAYPHLDKGVNGWFVRLTGKRPGSGTGYAFILAHGKVTELSLEVASADCFG